MSCRRTRSFLPIAAITLAILALPAFPANAAQPLKVYILAGQSNMQGAAALSTIARLAMTPDSLPMYKEMTGGDGKYETKVVWKEGDEPNKWLEQYKGKQYTVVPNTYIAYLGAARMGDQVIQGPLSVGFGAKPDKIGPEFTFGLYMQKHLQEPILIIKAAWGGKNIFLDFRPPSAGPFFPDPSKVEDRKGNKGIITAEERIARAEKAQHRYYNLMVKHVKSVLADPGKYHPAYDKEAGYEIDGFVWFQGWNDLVGPGDIYPWNEEAKDAQGILRDGQDVRDYSKYSELLAQFIRDVRKDVNAPNMPFVIGVIGVGGEQLEPDDKQLCFRKAMAAPAGMPEFKDTVAAVHTAKYWDIAAQGLRDKVRTEAEKRVAEDFPEIKRFAARNKKISEFIEQLTPEMLTAEEIELINVGTSHAGFHYMGSAYTYGKIGEAFAKAMIDLEP